MMIDRRVVLATFLATVAVSGTVGRLWFQSINNNLTTPPALMTASDPDLELPGTLIAVKLALHPGAVAQIANALVPTEHEIAPETHRKELKVLGKTVASASVDSYGSLRRGEIYVAAKEGTFEARVKVDASMTLFKGSLKTSAAGSVQIAARTQLDVGSDWRLTPTTAISHQWLESPSASLAGLTISLRTVAERELNSTLHRLQQEFDSKIAESLSLKQAAGTLWAQSTKPIRLNRSGDLWLVAEPRQVTFHAATSSENDFVVILALEAILHVVHGAEPLQTEAPPMPPLVRSPSPDAAIALHVPFEARYETLRKNVLAALPKDAIAIMTASAGYANVRFLDVKIYPSSPNLVVGVQVSIDAPTSIFDTKGWVYLYGTPSYDEASSRLTLEGLDFSLDFDNSAFQTVSTAFSTKLRDYLRTSASWNFSEEVDALRAGVQDQARDLPTRVLSASKSDAPWGRLLGPRLSAEGRVTRIAPVRLAPLESGLSVTMKIEGDLTLSLVPVENVRPLE